MADKPAWRSVFDQVMGEVSPRLIDVTGSDTFAEAVEVAEAVRVRASSELQRNSRRFLHSMNLPAGSDVAVMRQEIGALNREVRALARMVETLQERLEASESSQRPSEPTLVEVDALDDEGNDALDEMAS